MALYPIKGIRVGGDVHPIDYDALHGKKCVEFTEQTLTDEQKAQARTNIDVPSLDTVASIETQLNGSISANKKQIENLKKLAQGKIYDFETDTTSAYVKDVPAGAAPYSAMKAIGGKSIVMNQLSEDVKTGRWIGFNSNVSVTDDGWLSCTSTSSDTYSQTYFKNDEIQYGHKFFVRFDYALGENNESIQADVCGKNLPAKLTDKSGVYCTVGESNTLGTHRIAVSSNKTPDVETEFKIKNVVLIDLTLAGLEDKTVEELNAMFPDYIPYNAGEIVSAEVQNVKALGVNKFDIERFKEFSLENGGTVTETTAGLIASKVEGKTLFSGFKTNTRYAIKFSGSNSNGGTLTNLMLVYTNGITANMDFSDSVWVSDANKSVDKLVGKLFTGTATFNLNDCYIIPLEDGQTADTVELKPYKSDTLVIPEDVKQLEGYGWSAGSVCNEVDFERKKFIKRVEKFVLTGNEGTYAGYTQALSGVPYVAMFKNVLTEAKYAKETSTDGAARYIAIGLSDSGGRVSATSMNWVPAGDIGMWRETISLGFDDVKTESDVKAMLPITIYYELATPEEIDISDILTDDNLIEVEQGGTLTFEQSNDVRLPVPSEVEYMINLQEAAA